MRATGDSRRSGEGEASRLRLSGSRHARRGRLLGLSTTLLAASISALVLGATPASALTGRAHVLALTFGSGGLAHGQFEHPDGVAVNNSTHIVFVADRGNQRVDEFKPKLSTEGAVEGETYIGSFHVPYPQGVVVDNSTEASDAAKGDIYVLGSRSLRTLAERQAAAKQLKAEAKELKHQAAGLLKEAKKLEKEAKKLKKEAEKLPVGGEKKAKEEEAKAKEEEAKKKRAGREALLLQAKGLQAQAKEDLSKEEPEEEASEILQEASAPEYFWVYKFSPSGTLLATIHDFHKEGEVLTGEQREEHEFLFESGVPGIALNKEGDVLVFHSSPEIFEFANSGKGAPLAIRHVSVETELLPPFAVDSEEDLYLGVEEYLGSNEGEEELITVIQAEDEREGVCSKTFAVLAKVDRTTGKELNPALDPECTTAAATTTDNDVYAANVSPAGDHEDATTIAAFGPGGELIERFGAPGLKLGMGVTVDPGTGAVYVADAQSNDIDIFEPEPPGAPQLSNLSACVAGGGECTGTTGTVTLRAQVDPTGAATTYQFEYGPGSCSAVPSPCTITAAKAAGEGFEQVQASEQLPELSPGEWHYRLVASNKFGTVRSAEQTLSVISNDPDPGLPDARQWQMVTPPDKNGAEPETMNRAGGEIQASENGDAITFPGDGPMGSEPEGSRNPEWTQLLSTRGPHGWSTQDITTPNTSDRGLLVTFLAETEYQDFSPNLALSLVEPFPGRGAARPAEEEAKNTLAEPPLSPPQSGAEVGHQEQTFYLRDDGPEELLAPSASEVESYRAAAANGATMHNSGFLALVDEGNAPGGEAFGGGEGREGPTGVRYSLASTPDLSHVAFYSNRAAPGIYEWGPKGSCSTESPICTGGDVQLVSVFPNGTEAPASYPSMYVGGSPKGINTRNAISSDGALVFWSTSTKAGGETYHLFVRDTITQETLQLDTVQPGATGEGHELPEFADASADGTKVFFTDDQRLTPDSHSLTTNKSQQRPDLYVVELSGGRIPGSPLSHTVTDLTPQGITPQGKPDDEAAEVQAQGGNRGEGGGVLGTSEDGSYVYFVANGALSPKARKGTCLAGTLTEAVEPEGNCNLYFRHYNGHEWEPAVLVAVLAQQDMPDWGGEGAAGALTWLTSRVSPNGRYLAFMSSRSLTGYDNEDVTSEAEGERPDEEVFLYDAASEKLRCASCSPDGARPAGIQDVENESPLFDQEEIWTQREDEDIDTWLAGDIPGWTTAGERASVHQSRYLSNEGRLFFNSPVDLVEGASGEDSKVYEYEPDGLGSCHSGGGCIGLISSPEPESESAFLDASADGNDVFFITADKLVEQDTDQFYDVYDAHVCEPSSPCLPPPANSEPPCQSRAECSQVIVHNPSLQTPASASVSGPGNIKPAHNVLSITTSSPPPPKPKSLTRAQKLAKALKACKKDHKKSKRMACEKQAHKLYGPIKKAKKSSTKGKRG